MKLLRFSLIASLLTILCSTSHINAQNTGPSAPEAFGFEPIEAQEKEIILRALQEKLWIQKDAANFLGISPRALNYKIKKFGITHPRWRKNQ